MSAGQPPVQSGDTPDNEGAIDNAVDNAVDNSVSDLRQALPRKSKLTLAFIGLTGLVTFGAGIVFAAYCYLNYKYSTTPEDEAAKVVFDVPRGSGLSSIAARLENDGLIDSAFIFKAVTKLRGGEADFKAGEFEITVPASMNGIFEQLSEGKTILYPFTAPEGLTSAMIMRELDKVQTLTGELPPTPAEGTLLPETYMTPRGMSKTALIDKMQQAQTELLDELWDKRAPDLPITSKEEAIILASVVEKETGVGGERKKVAGVFINRLNRGMKLESDPTIIYGISQGEPLGRGLRVSEIARKTDWNTYQIPRLPKTAICNPGAQALAAVLNPEQHDYIFFVADGTGGHAFSKTYTQHLKYVANWRRVERSRQSGN